MKKVQDYFSNNIKFIMIAFLITLFTIGVLACYVKGNTFEEEAVVTQKTTGGLHDIEHMNKQFTLLSKDSKTDDSKTDSSEIDKTKIDRSETLKESTKSKSSTVSEALNENKKETADIVKENPEKLGNNSSNKQTTSSNSNSQKTTNKTPSNSSNNTKPSTSKTEEQVPVASKDTTKPVLSGVSNISIEYGTSFNPMTGVSATDNVDGNISSRISITGSVNTSVQGNYTLKYTVSDNAGNIASSSRIVTVKEKPTVVTHETSLENQLFNLVNEYRTQNGIEQIQFSDNQYSKANNLAKSKADANTLDSSHYANEISIVFGGGRPSASQLLNMWKASPSHNDFLLNTRKHYGGCAIYSNGNTFYVILEARIDNR